MINDGNGNKVSATIKAKILLKKYLSEFNLTVVDSFHSSMTNKESDKVQEQVDKLIERMSKALKIKE